MAETFVVEALEEAQFVKTSSIGDLQYVQVWYGGTQVRVFCVARELEQGLWDEVTVWSLSDEKGRPPEQDEVREHMEMHAECVKESMKATWGEE